MRYKPGMNIIAGDIGGTNSRLAWVSGKDYAVHRLHFECVYPSARFADGASLLRQFMHDAKMAVPPACLVLALPGPGDSRQVKLTNLNWVLNADAIRASLGIDSVRFMNDFQAAAAGVETLGRMDSVTLNDCPVEARAVRAITGAGTGLGLAWMVCDTNGRYHTFASEGGHVDFAPADAGQSRLLDFLRQQWGHVSWERAVSGAGLGTIYRFCRHEMKQNTTEKADSYDGARIADLDQQGDPVASSALDMFVDLYGAWVGNVALLFQPGGGLYIAGGVAKHLRDRMQSPRFMAACRDKGRMREVVERTPIFLITNERLGLQGAIWTAFAVA